MGQEVSFEGNLEAKKVVNYLEDLVAGCKVGKICVQQGEDFVVLKPSDLVEIEVEASQKGETEKFSMKLSWNRKDKVEHPPQLKISSSDPVIRTEKKEEEKKEHSDKSASSKKKK